MSKRHLFLKTILPVLILLIGVTVTLVMIKTRQTPHAEERVFAGPLVDFVEVATSSRQVLVNGTGTVQARNQVEITPQVSGRIDWISDQMVNGGFFRKDEPLFSIEAVDYQLALDRAQANLAQAELELIRIESQAEIAREEWARLKREDEEEPNPLVLYGPQLKTAKAALLSAQAAVRQAELDLSRTRITAPFNCYVRNEMVDLGQYVRSGNSVATVAGTDAVEIVVPLPLEELPWLNVPRNNDQNNGSVANVILDLGERQVNWRGRIVRALGDVDPRNRMASVVVAVLNPFEQQKTVELAPGMFVEVLLRGNELTDVIALPRTALRDEDTVWLVDKDNRLEIRKVEIIRREQRDVIVSDGLAAGDRVVLTNLAGAANGMLLRPQLRESD